MRGLESKVILVTGGTRGVGRAVAEAVLEAGGSAAICARTEDHLAAARAAFGADRFLAVRADVRQRADLVAFHAAAVERFGAIHGLVNNAGTAIVGPLIDATDQQVQGHLDEKLLAYLRLTQLVVPTMRRSGGGSIVNVAGAAGVDPAALTGVAGMINAAVQNMSRMLADELAESHIRVNVVNPGTLDTDLGRDVLEGYAQTLGMDVDLVRAEMRGAVPLGRIPVARDIADAVLFFLSSSSSMITGSSVTPDGGILIRRMRS
jgi:3-oxoacyl-[acyl-carrier protein] reductase